MGLACVWRPFQVEIHRPWNTQVHCSWNGVDRVEDRRWSLRYNEWEGVSPWRAFGWQWIRWKAVRWIEQRRNKSLLMAVEGFGWLLCWELTVERQKYQQGDLIGTNCKYSGWEIYNSYFSKQVVEGVGSRWSDLKYIFNVFSSRLDVRVRENKDQNWHHYFLLEQLGELNCHLLKWRRLKDQE